MLGRAAYACFSIFDLRETEGGTGSEASPGSPAAQVSCSRMERWRHAFRRTGVAHGCLGERQFRCLGSPPGQRPPGPWAALAEWALACRPTAEELFVLLHLWQTPGGLCIRDGLFFYSI